jgi:hypothetical protein
LLACIYSLLVESQDSVRDPNLEFAAFRPHFRTAAGERYSRRADLLPASLPQFDAATEAALRQALAASAAAGFYYLASSLLGEELPVSLVFFRQA